MVKKVVFYVKNYDHMLSCEQKQPRINKSKRPKLKKLIYKKEDFLQEEKSTADLSI